MLDTLTQARTVWKWWGVGGEGQGRAFCTWSLVGRHRTISMDRPWYSFASDLAQDSLCSCPTEIHESGLSHAPTATARKHPEFCHAFPAVKDVKGGIFSISNSLSSCWEFGHGDKKSSQCKFSVLVSWQAIASSAVRQPICSSTFLSSTLLFYI